MDTSSIELALQLQREDLQIMESAVKGKQRAGEKTDLELALEAYYNELQSVATQSSDHTLALSIARAVRSDACIIAEAQEAEEQAERDRRFAIRLSENPNARVPRRRNPKKNMAEMPDDDLIEYLQSMNLEDEYQSESSGWAASRKPSGSRECVACGDRFPPLALSRSPCSHEYCRECLVGLVRSSLQDESLFPPRCCNQSIPIDTGRWFSTELVGQFRAKKLEYETPNRTYCSEPTCSTFVPPTFITGEVARCPKCSRRTCTHCKARHHTGVCREDTASQQLLQLAAENGWQSCNACHRMVELNLGCFHMTCLCGAQFCYVCGVPWKNCACPQWDEGRLIQRANDIVDRDDDVGRINARERQLRVERERTNLMENHECAHERWKGRPGPRECEECNQVLPVFIYECRQCHIMACRRCRYNRL